MREGGNDAGEEEEEAAAARVWFSWLRVGGSCREENHWDGNGERVVLSASSRRLGGMGTGRRRRRLADDRNLPCQGCQRGNETGAPVYIYQRDLGIWLVRSYSSNQFMGR